MFDDDENALQQEAGASIGESELIAITDDLIRQSIGYMGGKLSEQRRRNEYYYLAQATGDMAPPSVAGRSAVISTDVADTVEWMLPGLLKTFTAGDTVVEFTPRRQEDEESAKQATEYVNYVLHKQNPGFQILYTWIKDALIQKNGILKVWWDDSIEDIREPYHNLTDVEVQMLLSQPEVEPIEHTARPDPNYQAPPQNLGPAPMPPDPVPMLHDLVIKRRKAVGQVRIENVPPEEFLISRNAKSIAASSFVAHRVEKTISDLRALGYANIEEIGGDGNDNAGAVSAERVERRSFDDESPYTFGRDISTADESQRVVWVTECYLRIDYNGDGIAEWRQVVRCGGVILRNEECDGPPFVSITPIPLPHRFFGLCPADLAIEPQRLKTSILRASLDGLYHSINGRTYAVDDQVNLDDLLTNRPGGVVRVKTPQSVGPLMEGKPDLGAAQSMLEYAEVLKENRTGFTRYSQGTNADALNQTATGMNIITNRSDSRLELIARVFAETGFQDLFKRVLQLVSQHQDQATMARVNGKWVNFDPRAWATQFDFTVSVGLGTGNKDQLIQHLTTLGMVQKEAAAMGISGPPEFFNLAEKLSEALGFKQPELFFKDPKNSPPPPRPPDPKLLEVQNKQQYDIAALQLEREKEANKTNLARERLEAEITLKREEMALRSRMDESALYAKLYGQSERFVDDDGREQPAASAGDNAGESSEAGVGAPALFGGVPSNPGGMDGPMGSQPGAGF